MIAQRALSRLIAASIAGAAMLLATCGGALAQTRVGGTVLVEPFDGATRLHPSAAYDSTNNAYLVTWGIATPAARTAPPIGARFVSADGVPLGGSVAVNTTGVSPQVDAPRAACGPGACLVAWTEEPAGVMGRLVRYNNGNVEFLGDQFVINQNGRIKLPQAYPAVAYSPVANEFLVSWSELASGSALPEVKGQRVTGGGVLDGPEIPIGTSSYWEGFPSLTYNSALNEYVVVYYLETSNSGNVAMQRVQPGTGALIGGRNTIYGSWFDQYPEIAYNSQRNQYLMITWGVVGANWMLHGRLADVNAEPASSLLSLAFGGGGPGLGLAYSPVTNSYLCVYQSQTNDEVWGVMVSADGLPGIQFQVTVSGTKLAAEPKTAASSASGRWFSVASERYLQIMGQLIEYDPNSPLQPPPPAACTTAQPGPDWTCVNGNWLPPGTAPPGSSCPTAQPGPDWICVNGNWVPPSTPPPGTSSCPTAQPGPDWTCVNGNWLPPGAPPPGTSSCPTVQPGPNWTCVNGNWLPPSASSGGTASCTTPQPGTGWTCVNGNWLPPGMAGLMIQPGPGETSREWQLAAVERRRDLIPT